MKHISIDIPDGLKDNIMFRVIVEEKEFSLIEDKMGIKFNEPTKWSGRDVIVRDLEIKKDKLVFAIEEL